MLTEIEIKNTQNIYTRIEALLPRMRTIAYGFSNIDEPEDLISEMIINMIELAKQDPSFSDQKDWYLLSQAKWLCYHKAARQRVEIKFIPMSLEDKETELYGEPDSEEMSFCSDGFSVEQLEDDIHKMQEVSDIADVVRKLSHNDQQIIKLVMLGYDYKEIAQKFGLTWRKVQYRMEKITTDIKAYLNYCRVNCN